MNIIPFHTTNWSRLSLTRIKGETGFALQRVQQYGDLRVRLVDYSADYKADHWCSRGHTLFCVDGEMDTEFQDGTVAHLSAGTSYQVTDRASVHLSTTRTGARLFIVDGGFLALDRHQYIFN